MSLTPGWEPKEMYLECPGDDINITLTMDDQFYFIDNHSEFKPFPRTKEGWADLCDTLKGFEP